MDSLANVISPLVKQTVDTVLHLNGYLPPDMRHAVPAMVSHPLLTTGGAMAGLAAVVVLGKKKRKRDNDVMDSCETREGTRSKRAKLVQRGAQVCARGESGDDVPGDRATEPVSNVQPNAAGDHPPDVNACDEHMQVDDCENEVTQVVQHVVEHIVQDASDAVLESNAARVGDDDDRNHKCNSDAHASEEGMEASDEDGETSGDDEVEGSDDDAVEGSDEELGGSVEEVEEDHDEAEQVTHEEAEQVTHGVAAQVTHGVAAQVTGDETDEANHVQSKEVDVSDEAHDSDEDVSSSDESLQSSDESDAGSAISEDESDVNKCGDQEEQADNDASCAATEAHPNTAQGQVDRIDKTCAGTSNPKTSTDEDNSDTNDQSTGASFCITIQQSNAIEVISVDGSQEVEVISVGDSQEDMAEDEGTAESKGSTSVHVDERDYQTVDSGVSVGRNGEGEANVTPVRDQQLAAVEPKPSAVLTPGPIATSTLETLIVAARATGGGPPTRIGRDDARPGNLKQGHMAPIKLNVQRREDRVRPLIPRSWYSSCGAKSTNSWGEYAWERGERKGKAQHIDDDESEADDEPPERLNLQGEPVASSSTSASSRTGKQADIETDDEDEGTPHWHVATSWASSLTRTPQSPSSSALWSSSLEKECERLQQKFTKSGTTNGRASHHWGIYGGGSSKFSTTA